MNGKNTGALLNKVFPVEQGMDNLLAVLDGTSSVPLAFLPSVMLLVPQVYVTRDQHHIEICGTVDEDSVEYEQGYRFFTNDGEFYYADGKYSQEGDHADDLTHLLDASIIPSLSTSPYLWVHPQHLVIKAWFNALVPGKVELTAGGRYVNRMGQVIELRDSPSDYSGMMIYRDNDNRSYTQVGTLLDSNRSMFDLVYEIKHWKLFCEQDWARAKVTRKVQSERQMMEMFDPTAEDRAELMRDFFTAMGTVYSLAERLKITLGFHIESD